MSRYTILSTKKLDTPTLQLLQQQGAAVTEYPFIETRNIITEHNAKIIQGLLKQPAYVAFTSANAVNAFKKYGIGQRWKIFCTSGRTRLQLLEYNEHIQIVGVADDANTLADHLARHSPLEVYFFCGDKRREDLAAVLEEHGTKVNEIIVYETILTPVTLEKAFDAVLFFGPTAVESFFSRNQLSQKTVCFCIGPTTAAALKKYTINPAVIADRPTQEAISGSVVKYFTIHH